MFAIDRPETGHGASQRWWLMFTRNTWTLRHVTGSVLLFLCLTSIGRTQDQKGPIEWQTDLAAGMAEARKQGNKLLILNFSSKTCVPCQKMKMTTFQDPQLAQMIKTFSVPVALDYEQAPLFFQHYNVKQFPTTLILTVDGQEMARLVGYRNTQQFTQDLANAVVQARKINKTGNRSEQYFGQGLRDRYPHGGQLGAEAHQRQSVAETREQLRGTKAPKPDSTPVPTMPTDDVTGNPVLPAVANEISTPGPNSIQPVSAERRLAVNGYCLVTMIEAGQMVLGKPEFQYHYSNQVYQFTSQKALEQFRKSPMTFLPGEYGRCVVTFSEKGVWEPGNTQYPALYNDHVFFFTSAETRNRFLADPEQYVDERGQSLRRTRFSK